MESIKLALLERAAENAFQNKDIHLANAFYDRLAKGKYDPKPAEEGKCGEQGCIRKTEGGYHVISNKTGKPWSSPDGTPKVYASREKAENALSAYHATKGFARAPRG